MTDKRSGVKMDSIKGLILFGFKGTDDEGRLKPFGFMPSSTGSRLIKIYL